MTSMTRWAKGQSEFTVSLNHDTKRGCIAIIPKPVLENLGVPDRLKFVMVDGQILVRAGEK